MKLVSPAQAARPGARTMTLEDRVRREEVEVIRPWVISRRILVDLEQGKDPADQARRVEVSLSRGPGEQGREKRWLAV